MNHRVMPLRETPSPICEPMSCHHCAIHRLCQPVGLGRADMALLERIIRRKEVYQRGEALFHAGDCFEYVYAIRSGSAKTHVCTDDGRVQITGFHIAGELLGLGAFASRVHVGEARALETMSVCKVEIARLDEISQEVPAIQYQMMRVMSEQIRRNEELMLLLGKRSAEERLAEFLIDLSRRFASRNYSGIRFRLSMSRLDIGNYLGLAEETVCRIFRRFQEDGLITTERREIRLDDIKRLHELARLDLAA